MKKGSKAGNSCTDNSGSSTDCSNTGKKSKKRSKKKVEKCCGSRDCGGNCSKSSTNSCDCGSNCGYCVPEV